MVPRPAAGLTLRRKTLIVLLITILIVIAPSYLAMRFAILSSYAALEEEETLRNLQRVLSALDQNKQALRGLAEDWAYRDDTYQFIQDRNPQYVETHIQDSTFSSLGTSLLVLIERNGEMALASGYDLGEGRPEPAYPQQLIPLLTPDSPLIRHPDRDSSWAGIVVLPAGPMLVATAPIMTSQRDGPIQGTLVWGCLLDEVMLARLGEGMGTTLEVFPTQAVALPEGVQEALARMREDADPVVLPVDDHTVAGYALLETSGQPALILRASQPRRLYTQGRRILLYGVAGLAGMAVMLAAISVFLLERMVLSRVARLGRSIQQIGTAEARVELPGRDELSALAATINDVLAALEASQRSVRENEQRFRSVLSGASVILINADRDGVVTQAQGKGLSAAGIDPQRLVGVRLLQEPAIPRVLVDRVRQALAGEEVAATADHEGRVFDIRFSPTRDAEGQVAGVVAVATDITERAAAEAALQDSLGQYQRLFEESRDAVYVTAFDGTILSMNPAGHELFGYDRSMIGLNAVHLYSDPADRARFQQEIERLGSVHDYEVVLRRADGAPIDCVCTSTVRRDATGQIVGYEGIVRDVTSRKLALVALQESEQRYRRLVELSPDAVAVHVEGRLLYVNPAGARLFGVSAPEELVGQSLFDFVHPDYRALFVERSRNSQGDENGSPAQERFVRHDGRVIEVEVVAIPVVYYGQNATQVVVRDVTARADAERALRRSEAQFRQVFEDSSIGMALVERGGRLIATNEAFQQFLGCTEHELRWRHLSEFAHPDDVEESLRLLHELQAGQPDQFDLETRYVRKDGQIVWARVRVSRFYGGEGSDAYGLVMADDITERRRAEEAEREQHAILEALRDTGAALSSTLDLDEVFDLILDSVERVVPHQAAAILLVEGGVARTVRWHAPPPYDQSGLDVDLTIEQTNDLQEMVATRRPVLIDDTREFEGWVDIPSQRWIRSSISAPICVDDAVIGFLDLHSASPRFFKAVQLEHLRLFADQAALAIKNARLYDRVAQHAAILEDRNRELDAFGYTVAHDLKSPLQVVIGYANLLRTDFHEPIGEQTAVLLGYIEDYAERMNRMVESLLLLARLRSADSPITEVAMQPVVEAALTRLKPVLEERSVTVKVEPDLPPALGYAPWLEEVFANLIDNAVKYIGDSNPRPRVVIRGARKDDSVRYEVQDNGIGIEAADLQRLFEMFAQLHRDRGVRGSGLGLSIVKRIVTKLNGEVGVTSKPQQGSTFWFTLPAPEE